MTQAHQRTTTNGLGVDRAEAERFLQIIGRGAACFTFQTADDNVERRKADDEANALRQRPGKKPLWSPFVRVRHGTLAGCFVELARLNRAGAAIYVTVNATDFRGRKAKNVVRVRSLFIDLDGNRLPTEGPRPHVIVESSPGKWHVYWLVDGVGLDEFKAKQMALLARHGGDDCINYMNCVLRLPGFLHQKGEPHLVRIVEVNDLPPYRADEFPSAPAPSRRTNGDDRLQIARLGATPDGKFDLEEIKWAMAEMPNEKVAGAISNADYPRHIRYKDWLALLMACHHAFGGSDCEGWRVFDAWLRKNPDKYDARIGIARRTWANLKGNPVSNVTGATVFWYANRAAPGWRDRYHAAAALRVAEANRRSDDPMLAEIAAFTAERKTLGKPS
jgi:hypothetical protein